MIRTCCLSAALLAASAATAAETKLYDPRDLSDPEKQIVRAAVEDVLKDAETARFRWLPFNGYSSYCGEVNAKNSYGGYAGYSKYMVNVDLDSSGKIVSATKPMVLSPDTGDGITTAIVDVCMISTRGPNWQNEPPAKAK